MHGAPASFALAMELVEGEDLAQRITRLRAPGASARQAGMPLDEVWPLARQIAEGLEAAHEAGIVHRDLEPANIRVTPDGVVKVLDFGLAKALDPNPAGASAGATHSPTVMTSPAMTLQGIILGTAAYMAPEQARGRPVDRRADIWAFGCVVYELLTGRRAFDGEDVPDILGAIIKSEPDWTKLPAATPARVHTLLARCLTKDRTQRLQHIGDARLELTTLWDNSPEPVTAQPRAARFHIPLAEDQQFTNVGRHVLAFSPDGSRLVFVANTRLYLRDLATDDVEVIQGSESRAGVLEPVFSPDGEWVAYYSNDDRALKRIRINGGGAQIISESKPVFGMSWGESGLLFGDGDTGILRVNPDGGHAGGRRRSRTTTGGRVATRDAGG